VVALVVVLALVVLLLACWSRPAPQPRRHPEGAPRPRRGVGEPTAAAPRASVATGPVRAADDGRHCAERDSTRHSHRRGDPAATPWRCTGDLGGVTLLHSCRRDARRARGSGSRSGPGSLGCRRDTSGGVTKGAERRSRRRWGPAHRADRVLSSPAWTTTRSPARRSSCWSTAHRAAGSARAWQPLPTGRRARPQARSTRGFTTVHPPAGRPASPARESANDAELRAAVCSPVIRACTRRRSRTSTAADARMLVPPDGSAGG